MEKRKRKQVASFADFAKSPKKTSKRLTEENVKIEVDFWDDCIKEVVQALKEETFGLMNWENLVDYCRTKYEILGREVSAFDDDVVLQHIKDLIFYRHGDSLFDDGAVSGVNAVKHSKGIVIEELAHTILDKVKEMTSHSNVVGEEDKENPPTGHLVDKHVENNSFPDDECEDEDDMQCEKRIKGFQKYFQLLEETVQKMRVDKYPECIERTMRAIEKEAGSTDMVDVIKVAQNKADEKDTAKILTKYLCKKAWDTISDYTGEGNIQVKGLDFNNRAESEYFVQKALDVLCCRIAKEVADRIQKKTGGSEKA